jgi:hypothetical protein
MLIYQPIEGGCWTTDSRGIHDERFLLVGDKTRDWNPERNSGRRINFKGRVLKDVVTTCMAGQPLEVIWYEFVEK